MFDVDYYRQTIKVLQPHSRAKLEMALQAYLEMGDCTELLKRMNVPSILLWSIIRRCIELERLNASLMGRESDFVREMKSAATRISSDSPIILPATETGTQQTLQKKKKRKEIPPKTPIENKTKKKGVQSACARDLAMYYNSISKNRLCPLCSDEAETLNMVAHVLTHYGEAEVKSVILQAVASDVLCGASRSKFVADFFWLFEKKNYVRIKSGFYDNKNVENSATGEDGSGTARFLTDKYEAEQRGHDAAATVAHTLW